MRRHWFLCAVAAVFPVADKAGAQGQVTPERDLTAAIALSGQPCGSVQKVEKRGENDWNATCSDGRRYRVYADSQGRARVEKR